MPLPDPLNPDATPATTIGEKREVLARNLLHTNSDAGDIPLDSPAVSLHNLPFPDITDGEIKNSVFGAGNTAAGEDEIPTAVLKIGWHLIEGKVSQLFRRCLVAGHHPACLKSAILVINKPNKPDRSNPRSYRPIALLSVLVKSLERLVARWLAWISINARVIASQQFGALPLRSATDLTTCLVHDVESTLNSKRTASLLTLDVRGAFDSVLPGLLARRLREQGWPDHLIRWVIPFSTGRSVKIRLDGTTGPSLEVHCGLRQGSPASPIFFMLHIAPLFTMGTSGTKFGYADDIAILRTSSTSYANAELLSQDLQKILEWGRQESVSFDHGKTELLHFSRRRADQDAGTTPAVTSGPITVTESQRLPYTRWLGVLFDKKHSFKWHACATTEKVLKVGHALSSLRNTVRVAPPHLVRHAALACVLPIAYYGAESWWPGRFRQGARARISNRVESTLHRLEKVVFICAGAILPVYRTTPTAALLRESGIRPSEIAPRREGSRCYCATPSTRPLSPSSTPS
ncbi:hypothetical protein K3495_g10073 [Podosphaera aphanis]|nr:hypothetical protein K3495_g10073 [Podosphaera aphanis]